MKLTSVIVGTGVFALAGMPALSHHSANMFDPQKETVLHGSIKEFQWSNPHTWIQLNVADESGKVLEWSIEGSSPNQLGRQGLKRNTLKPGDELEITVHPLRDGQPGGSFVRAVMTDGRKLGGGQVLAAPGATK